MATATRTAARLPTPAPMPEYLDLTRMIARRARVITGIRTLAVLAVAEPFGAPARYIPATREVHIHASVLEHIDIRSIRSVAELNAKHPEVMGVVLHELFHAIHSMNADNMALFQRVNGARRYKTLAMLDEGRIESLGFPTLTGIEQEALRAMVPEFVLRDVDPDDEPDEQVRSLKQGIRLVGLLAARAEAEVLDLDNPRCMAIWTGTVQAMGEWFGPFFNIAQQFAAISALGHSGSTTELIDEWIALEDALIEQEKDKEPKPKKSKGEPSEGDGSEESEESSDPTEGEGSEEGEPDKEGESEADEEGDEESKSKGAGDENEGDEESEDEGSGGDDEDEGSNGGADDEADADDEQEPSLGDYGSSDDEPAVDTEAIREIVRRELPQAAQDQREASGKRLQEAVWDMERTVITDHDERRRKNQEAMSRWQ